MTASRPKVERVPVLWRRFALMAWDVLAWVAAFVGVVAVRYDFSMPHPTWVGAFTYLSLAVIGQVVGGLALHLYLGRSRVGSFDEATVTGMLVLGIGVALGLLALLVPAFPRGLSLALPLAALLVMGAGRWGIRAWLASTRLRADGDTEAAIVYGAGDAGHQVARLVRQDSSSGYSILGFVDDDPSKRFLRLYGFRVLGSGANVVDIARSRGATVVILAITNAGKELIQGLSDRCRAAGVRLVVVPSFREIIDGRIQLRQLREFSVADLLGRRPVETNLSEVAAYVTGKSVLVTGAGGSIGSELARQLHRLGPSRLVLLDRDESGLHATQLSVYGSGLLDRDDIVLNDIRDAATTYEVFQHYKPDIVFHAAALKHLPMLERFPAEGWRTNVLGTLNVLRAAQAAGARRFVNISTDKAADATSVLGLTKRVAERLTAWYADLTQSVYLSVRFGNVLGSRGSVLYAFDSQIRQGGPVTVTHPDVTRFFMTIPEACELVLQAGAIGSPGDVLILDMGEPVRIVDVARRMIEQSGGEGIEIRFTGLRKGEKLEEVLVGGGEEVFQTKHPLINQVPVPPIAPKLVEGEEHDDAASVRQRLAELSRRGA